MSNKLDILEIQISDLSGFFRSMALTNQVNQGNEKDMTKKLFCSPEDGGFDWYATPEGFDFWHEVGKQNYIQSLQKYKGEDNLLIIESFPESSKIRLHTDTNKDYEALDVNDIATLEKLTLYKKSGYRIFTINKTNMKQHG